MATPPSENNHSNSSDHSNAWQDPESAASDSGSQQFVPGATAPKSTPVILTRTGISLWLRVLLTAAVGYGAMLVVAGIAIVLSIMGFLFAAAGNADGSWSPDALRNEVSTIVPGADQSLPGALQMFLTLPFQLVGLALFGRLGLWGSIAYQGESMEGTLVSAGVTNLLIVGLGMFAMYLWWRLAPSRLAPSGSASETVRGSGGQVGQPSIPILQKVAVGVLTGLVSALLILFLTWATSLRWSSTSAYGEGIRLSVGAASGTLVFGAFLVFAGTLSALLLAGDLRERVTPARAAWAPSLSRAPRVFGLHLLMLAVPTALGAIIFAFYSYGSAVGFSALLWLPWLVLQVFGLANLSGVTTQWFAQWGTTADRSGQTSYLWGLDLPAWVVLLVVLVGIVGLVAASVSWLLRRDVAPATLANWRSWVVLPAVYLVGGLALQITSQAGARVAVGDTFDGTTATASVGLAPWTFLVFLLVGAVIEVLARWVAPAVTTVLPAPVIAFLKGGDPYPLVAETSVAARPTEAAAASSATQDASEGSVGGPRADDSGSGVDQSVSGDTAEIPISATAEDTTAPGQTEPEATAAGAAPGAVVSAAAANGAAEAAATHSASTPATEPTASTESTTNTGPQASAATQPQAFDPGSAAETKTPAQRKRTKRIVLLSLIAAVLVVGAFAAVQVISRVVFGPEQQVNDTLAALQDGRASEVVENADPNVPGEQRWLLADDVYEVSGNPVTSYTVTSVDRVGDEATVTVDVVQDSVTTPMQFTMTRDGREFGVFPSWRLTGIPTELYDSVDVSFPSEESMMVNGVEKEVPEEMRGRTVSLTALPGNYSFDPVAASEYLSYGEEQTVQVVLGTPTYSGVDFTASPTEALERDAEVAINARLDECAESTDFEPEGCPFSASSLVSFSPEDYRDPQWSIETYPSYSVSSASSSESTGSFTFSADSSGRVDLDYEYNQSNDDDEPDDWEPEDTQDTFWPSGTIEVTGDDLEVEFSD